MSLFVVFDCKTRIPKELSFGALEPKMFAVKTGTPDLYRSKISILGKENPGERRCSPGGPFSFWSTGALHFPLGFP